MDTHVYAGYTVPPYYDSLLAKVIVHGNDREEALTRMGQALDSFILEGVTTTIPFLARVIRHPDFVAGNVDTRFLERESQLLRPDSMKLDVAFAPGRPAPPPRCRAARCSSSTSSAPPRRCARRCTHGAKAIIPVASTEEALRLAQTIGSADVLLAGEKNCVRIPGFHLGNSPLEMTEAAVRGKTLIVTTTNGTKALLACQGAAAVYLAGAANLTLAAEKARECVERDGGVLIVCAGRGGAFSLDDAYCAGRLAAATLGGPRAAARPQRRGDREPGPGPPLRRSLGASAHATAARAAS